MNVSIIIAARNEEVNLPRLLRSIVALSYPKNRLSVFIGDDGSTDGTAAIIKAFADAYSFATYVPISKSQAGLLGKTNVLAQLMHHVKDEIVLFTDADIKVPVHWVEQMVDAFDIDTGVVTGITTSKLSDLKPFSILQGIEWLTALKIIESAARLNIPVTAMGNNMALRKSAYEAIGGYEAVGFSIVEDYAIFKAITSRGFGFKQLYHADVLAETVAMPDFSSFFKQRKRWLMGGLQSRSLLFIPAFFQALSLPIFLSLVFIIPQAGFIFLLFSFFTTVSSGYLALKPLKLSKWYKYLPAFYVFQLLFLFLQLINLLLPTKINWKGRTY